MALKSGISIGIKEVLAFLFLIAFVSQISFSQDYDISERQARTEYLQSIPVTTWPNHAGGQPTGFKEWRAKTGDPGPFQIDMIKKIAPSNKRDAGLFGIFVNSDLYPLIESSIDTYINDLIADGYSGTLNLFQISGGTEVEFKQFLQTKYAEGLTGCILIGDLPIAWYEEYCWDVDETFPCDLYYMDMDGIWEDYDSNGVEGRIDRFLWNRNGKEGKKPWWRIIGGS